MNIAFKKIDSWGQILLIVGTVIIAPFTPFLVLYAYFIIGAWQLMSVCIYILAGSGQERAHRKNYWLGILLYGIVCFICFNIKDLVVATIYLLWFVPAVFALSYGYITLKELNFWPFRRLNPQDKV